MNLTNIQSDIQSYLGITLSTSSRVTTTEVLAGINQDYRNAQSKLANANVNYYQGEIQTLDIEDGVDKYQLPTKFLAMKRMEIQYEDDVDKVRVTPADINDIQNTVNPESDPWSKENPFYAIWEDDFYIKAIPDSDSSAWTTDSGNAIKLWFIEMQDDLSGGTDIPSLPEAFHHILAYGATAKGFRKLRKFTEAREYEALLRDGFLNMISENTYKDKTKPMGFSISRGSTNRSGIIRP